MWSTLRTLTNPSVRTRRVATSSFFLATFGAAILTVSLSASTILPCPAANKRTRATLADDDDGRAEPSADQQTRRQSGGVGERVLLTSKGGWIEIERPPRQRVPA